MSGFINRRPYSEKYIAKYIHNRRDGRHISEPLPGFKLRPSRAQICAEATVQHEVPLYDAKVRMWCALSATRITGPRGARRLRSVRWRLIFSAYYCSSSHYPYARKCVFHQAPSKSAKLTVRFTDQTRFRVHTLNLFHISLRAPRICSWLLD
jgi:hypothetical protein